MDVELDFFCADGVTPAIDNEEAQRLIRLVLEDRNVERDCMVSLSFVSDDSIAELNGTWRNNPHPTDVLSFEMEHPWDENLAQDEPCELGDIVIAPDFVAQQATEFGTTEADETRLMLVHGMLHLLGFDHMNESDACKMQQIEDAILARMGGDGTLTEAILTRHRGEEA